MELWAGGVREETREPAHIQIFSTNRDLGLGSKKKRREEDVARTEKQSPQPAGPNRHRPLQVRKK